MTVSATTARAALIMTNDTAAEAVRNVGIGAIADTRAARQGPSYPGAAIVEVSMVLSLFVQGCKSWRRIPSSRVGFRAVANIALRRSRSQKDASWTARLTIGT